MTRPQKTPRELITELTEGNSVEMFSDPENTQGICSVALLLGVYYLVGPVYMALFPDMPLMGFVFDPTDDVSPSDAMDVMNTELRATNMPSSALIYSCATVADVFDTLQLLMDELEGKDAIIIKPKLPHRDA